jgi:hypothetical protein
METYHAGKTIAGAVSRFIGAVSACLPSRVVARDKDRAMGGFMRPVGEEGDLDGHVSTCLDDPDKTRAPRSPDGERSRVASSPGTPLYGQLAPT